MATENTNVDPNAEHENKIGPDHGPISPADQWGEKLNPLRETPEPWSNLRDGGTPGSG